MLLHLELQQDNHEKYFLKNPLKTSESSLRNRITVLRNLLCPKLLSLRMRLQDLTRTMILFNTARQALLHLLWRLVILKPCTMANYRGFQSTRSSMHSCSLEKKSLSYSVFYVASKSIQLLHELHHESEKVFAGGGPPARTDLEI